MGRQFAAILGPLAMVIVLLRSAWQGAGTNAALTTAIFSLMIFALVGWVVGRIAETTVRDFVRLRFETELDRIQKRAAEDEQPTSVQ